VRGTTCKRDGRERMEDGTEKRGWWESPKVEVSRLNVAQTTKKKKKNVRRGVVIEPLSLRDAAARPAKQRP